MPPLSVSALRSLLEREAHQLGFSAVRVSRPTLQTARKHLATWLAAGYQGAMTWLERDPDLRTDPSRLWPGTTCILTVSLPYLGEDLASCHEALNDPARGVIAQYALGQDYHRLMRRRLHQLAERLTTQWEPFAWRPFSDSAPLLEVEIAAQGGLGWRGKHTLLLQRRGSYFFLGELLCNLPLPADPPEEDHCGTCQTCLSVCPTRAIVAPYQLDARLCIAYLTIEHPGPIPEPLRPLFGNRIYGCDDCQLHCPWNRFADTSRGARAFLRRKDLENLSLPVLFGWGAEDFQTYLAGSPIRRIGHERWLRNVAVALGNGPASPEALAALAQRRNHPVEQVREHVEWAWRRLQNGNSPSASQSE